MAESTGGAQFPWHPDLESFSFLLDVGNEHNSASGAAAESCHLAEDLLLTRLTHR